MSEAKKKGVVLPGVEPDHYAMDAFARLVQPDLSHEPKRIIA